MARLPREVDADHGEHEGRAMTSVERLYLNASALVMASEARQEARDRERSRRMERIEAWLCLSHDPGCATAWCTFSPSILPILVDYERDASVEVQLEAPDLARLEEFLDVRIHRFVTAYLGVREPESMYQRDLLVLDPVCGMRIRRSDAHAHLDHGGRRVFFCSDACRIRYEADPLRRAWPATPDGPTPTQRREAATAGGGRS